MVRLDVFHMWDRNRNDKKTSFFSCDKDYICLSTYILNKKGVILGIMCNFCPRIIAINIDVEVDS